MATLEDDDSPVIHLMKISVLGQPKLRLKNARVCVKHVFAYFISVLTQHMISHSKVLIKKCIEHLNFLKTFALNNL